MAEMNVSTGDAKKKYNKVRSPKISTRIDLTAMVDLGFLLITFFMLTTTFNKPKIVEVNMPIKDNTVVPPEIAASEALTLLLAENDSIYYYVGAEKSQASVTNYSREGIRNVILSQQEIVRQQSKNHDSKRLTVLIKAKNAAKYKNIVAILDEMTITGVTRYAILDYTPADSLIIYAHKGKG